MVGHMSVLDVEATCLGISKETFNPPSLPIEAERIHGRRDISDHQNQFITFDLLSLEAQWALQIYEDIDRSNQCAELLNYCRDDQKTNISMEP